MRGKPKIINSNLKRDIKYISFEDFLKMYNYTTKLRNKLILRLLFFGLFRRQELSNIRIENINFDKCCISLYSNDTKMKKQREVTINPTIVSEIKTYLDNIKKNKGYLFSTRQSKQITAEMINEIVKKVAKKCGLQKIYGETIVCKTTKNKIQMKRKLNFVTAHTLRHSGIIHMKNRGCSDSDIMAQSGHDYYDSFRIYSKLSTIDRQRELDKKGVFDIEER